MTFGVIVLIPLVLVIAAFMLIGGWILRAEQMNGYGLVDFNAMSGSVQTAGKHAQLLYESLSGVLEEDPAALEDREYLQGISDGISRKNCYILVRKGEALYYAGNEEAAKEIFHKLPDYGWENEESETGYFFDDSQKYVKQLDFVFSDGTPGSLFIVTRITSLIARPLLVDMFIAVLIILIFTAFMLTRWIHRGVFGPINQLNVAMKKIKDGNFDYMLFTDSKGEIGDLYRNYEDMRLRLKESTEEKMAQEKQNKELISNIYHDLKTPINAIKG